MADNRPSWIQAIGYRRVIVTIASVLLVFVVLALWADSHRWRRVVSPGSVYSYQGFGWQWPWNSAPVGISTVGISALYGRVIVWMHEPQVHTLTERNYGALGFEYYRYVKPQGYRPATTQIVYSHRYGLVVPFWAMVVAAALPAMVLLRQARRRWRTAKWLHTGRCVRCSYDLTGNTSGVCPECGTVMDRRDRTLRTQSS